MNYPIALQNELYDIRPIPDCNNSNKDDGTCTHQRNYSLGGECHLNSCPYIGEPVNVKQYHGPYTAGQQLAENIKNTLPDFNFQDLYELSLILNNSNNNPYQGEQRTTFNIGFILQHHPDGLSEGDLENLLISLDTDLQQRQQALTTLFNRPNL